MHSAGLKNNLKPQMGHFLHRDQEAVKDRSVYNLLERNWSYNVAFHVHPWGR